MKIFVALASLLLIGCATSTPRYQSAVPARHGAVEYIGPSFHIEITTAGYVTVGLSTGIGGVAGFLIGRTIHIEDSTGKALDPNLVGALGAVAGAGGGYLLSSATIYSTAPRNQRLSIGRVDEWLVALDDQLILIDTVRDSRRRDTIGSLTAVSKSVGDTFRIYSIDDAAFFYDHFYGHPREEEVIESATTRLGVRDVQRLALLYPTSPAVRDKLRIIVDECRSVESCLRYAKTYPEFGEQAMSRATSHLAEFDNPKSLQRLAERHPEIYDVADSLAAERARETGDAVAYVNAFQRGAYRAEFDGAITASIESATTIKELSNIVRRMPKLKDDAEKRASEIAISQRRYLQYSVYFPEGRHRLRVKDAERRERKSLLSAAHDRVLAVRDSSRAMGEYYEVRIPYDGEMLRWHSFTDWDGDGDDDLFFWYALLGHEVHDGRTPVANRIGAIENRDGVGVFVTDAEHSEFYRNGIHSIGDLSATGSTIRAVASRMDWEDRILTIEFDGSRFVYAGDRPNDGTREVQTSGGFIIGD